MVSGGNAGNRTQMWSACIMVSRGNAGNGLAMDSDVTCVHDGKH